MQSTYETSSLNQKMCKFNMFITAVCFLLLIKLRWRKNNSIYRETAEFRFASLEGNKVKLLQVA